MRTEFSSRIFPLLLGMLLSGITMSAGPVGIYSDCKSEQISFSAEDIKDALAHCDRNYREYDLSSVSSRAGDRVVITTRDNADFQKVVRSMGGDRTGLDSLGEQSFVIRTVSGHGGVSYFVIGGDETGAMYGGLELAERIYSDGWGAHYEISDSPYIRYRGMKLNMPLDRRIPTYVGGWSSNSTRQAIPNVWDMSFWKQLIDQQARYRYNMLSVWVHHPFPALVRVENYPDACLPGIEGFEGYENPLSYEDRVSFWREVMRYAHNRGMKFYFFDWNIYVDYAKDIYPEITRAQDNETTIEYTYESMKALIDTYPELDGFGVSGGDGMATYTDVQGNTEWTYKVYGRAVYDYLKEHPSRKFNLIHRRLGTTPDLWDRIYSPLDSLPNASRQFSSKYSQAHMYSIAAPKWSLYDISRIAELGHKTWLTVRNDDYFYINWGDHNYVREYVKSIPCKQAIEGIYIGSDGYTPSRAYLYRNPEYRHMLDAERRWYMEMLWGRISYNPDMDSSDFVRMLKRKYPELDAESLFEAWTLASRPLPKVTELVVKEWDLDFEWYPEACASDPGRCTGFRTIDDFAELTRPADGSLISDIKSSAAGLCGDKLSTYDLADGMRADAERALEILDSMDSHGDEDLELAIANISQMAHLSLYYAHKIKGATYKQAHRIEEARVEMAAAYEEWILYTRLMEKYYIPDSFRNMKIYPDWKFADGDVLREYQDLGGTDIR